MRPITLQASPANWQKFIARRLSPSFQILAKKIWQRDHYTCRYCDFQAQEYMDVVNHDQNYANNKASNLVTACGFCSQCFFLESIGLDDMSGGQLIFLPEISQENLNSFCHVIFSAMSSKAEYQDNAQIIYRNLKARNKPIEAVLGDGGSDPKKLGEMMVESQSLAESKSLQPFLKDVRVLPLQAKFNKQLEVWAKSATSKSMAALV